MTDRIDDDPLDDDLVAKFAQLDRVEPPDNWQRATERVGAPHGGDSSHRWWAAAAAAVLVVGGVIGVAATRGGEAPLQESAPTAAPVTSVPEADVVEPAVSEPPVAEPSVPATDVEGGVDTAVSDADDTVAVPVVEGLTEGQAVQTLRSLDFVVSVERTEVMPGDPNDGRVVSQDPLAATVLSTGDEIKIVIGQATIAATDQLAQTLTRFGSDLATAPTEATSLDGATFCGSEQLSNQVDRSVTMDVVGRRCLLDHHAARLPAVFVTESSTDEGDPIVVVMRTRADGTAESFVDSTRDDFGSGEWSSKECGRFVDLT
ncbi:MAG: PASTA domain-containing protein, partial [Ilumatobacter sp.]|uniref:PASTA domain-containing protein n=1 Tax=Ilumatobacter sp. TaxID=1967498 RepID=UPI003C775A4F